MRDCLAVIDRVRHLPRMDSESVFVFGGSGGGSLALELAGQTKLAAIAAGEPANVLFTGIWTKDKIPQLDAMMVARPATIAPSSNSDAIAMRPRRCACI